MLIIKEVEYAIRILHELHKENPLSAAEISKRANVPSPFIYRVIKKLEQAEIIEIKRGASGGCGIRKGFDDLTLHDVISAFDNTFIVIECMKKGYDCSQNKSAGCCLHREFGRIQGILKNEFKRKSLKSLFAE